jgi:dihydrofolate reductase
VKLYHLVAMAEGRVIGKDNRLPWHFSSDLKNFKQLTMGNTILMGRKTFESIGKPLPGRENFILSRHTPHPNPLPKGERGRNAEISLAPGGGEGWGEGELCYFSSIEEAVKSVRTPRAFIIGGAEIFRQTLDKIDGIYLTKIHAKYEGDAFYPEIPNSFKEVCSEILQDHPKIEFVFLQNEGIASPSRPPGTGCPSGQPPLDRPASAYRPPRNDG